MSVSAGVYLGLYLFPGHSIADSLISGNLPFDTTKTELEKHFESAEGLLSTRLMTDKQTKAPKGFAFLEFQDSDCLQKALKFHHTLFKRRQINVELTAGGGGKSEARQEKLQVKREKLRTERVSCSKA